MMITEDFLEILRCPLTHTRLVEVEQPLLRQANAAVQQGRLVNRSGEKVDPLDGGLVNEPRTLLYPVRDEIPCLLVEEAIELKQLDGLPEVER